MLRRSCSDILLNVDGGVPRFNLGGTGGNGSLLLKPGSQWPFFDSVDDSTVSVLEDEPCATFKSES